MFHIVRDSANNWLSRTSSNHLRPWLIAGAILALHTRSLQLLSLGLLRQRRASILRRWQLPSHEATPKKPHPLRQLRPRRIAPRMRRFEKRGWLLISAIVALPVACAVRRPLLQGAGPRGPCAQGSGRPPQPISQGLAAIAASLFCLIMLNEAGSLGTPR